MLVGGCGSQGVGCVGVPGEIDPTLRWVDGPVSASRLYAGRDGKTCDGVADHLALTAAETTDWVTHEQDLWEVLASECRAAKALAGTELTLNRYAVVGVEAQIRSTVVRRRVGASARTFEFVLKFHLLRLLFSGKRWMVEELLCCVSWGVVCT